MNRVIEIGRSTSDIELKKTTSGTSVVSFSIAVKRNYKNAEGNYDSDFFDCTAFNKLAETISRYVHKGDLLGVSGKLQTRTYTDKQGNNRKSVDIIVEDIEFLTTKKEQAIKEEPKVAEIDPFANNFEVFTDDDELPF